MKTNVIKSEFEKQSHFIFCWETSYKSIIYKRLLTCILDGNINVLVVCRSEQDKNIISTILETYCIVQEKIRFLLFDFQGVWVRDYAPFPIVLTSDNSNLKLANFIYNKNDKRPKNNDFSKVVSNYLELNLEFCNIKIAGGNLTTDGTSAIVCTKQLIQENSLSDQELNSVFTNNFGISKLIILDVLKNEHTGHIDMQVKFTSKDTILVTELPKDAYDYKTMEKNHLTLVEQLPKHFKIVRVPIATDNDSHENLGNVFYSYTNSIILNNKILVPLYGEKSDDIAMDIYKNLCPDKIIEGIYCKDIIQLKGALHCMCAQY